MNEGRGEVGRTTSSPVPSKVSGANFTSTGTPGVVGSIGEDRLGHKPPTLRQDPNDETRRGVSGGTSTVSHSRRVKTLRGTHDPDHDGCHSPGTRRTDPTSPRSPHAGTDPTFPVLTLLCGGSRNLKQKFSELGLFSRISETRRPTSVSASFRILYGSSPAGSVSLPHSVPLSSHRP